MRPHAAPLNTPASTSVPAPRALRPLRATLRAAPPPSTPRPARSPSLAPTTRPTGRAHRADRTTRAAAAAPDATLTLTADNVETVLDEVRPYLMAGE